MLNADSSTESREYAISFQGEHGAYSEQAALEFFGMGIKTVPCQSFEVVFRSVSRGESQFGLIPIENSLAGSIHQNYDLMLANDLNIVGEYHLRVSHCLLVLPGNRLDEIRRVYSHPQALAQCQNNLARLGLESVAQYDTAGSARLLRESGDQHTAALASRRAANVYGLDICIEHMEDNPANFTRFLALGKDPAPFKGKEKQEYKTSLVFRLHNRPGALFKALSVFALRDIDLSKIESRPIPGHPWEYLFYIDFLGNSEDPACVHAVENLGEYAIYLRVLGSYPRHQLPKS